jgi:4-hydroxybenzoate polyprenyltransferase
MIAAMIVHQGRFLDRRFWLDYAVTMRPYLLFVSAVTGMAGLSLVNGVPLPSLIVLGVMFFLTYGFAQALTDCFQTDTDRLSAPYRPLVRGTLRPRDVMVVSLIGLAACAAIVIAFNPANVLVAALTIVGVATYTWFKKRWWAGPWYNAWIVSLVVLIGYLAGAGAVGKTGVVSPALLGIMLAALAAYANFVLTGYFKDIRADRATGYRTLPVVFGRRISAWVSDGFAVLAFAGAGIALSGRAWDIGVWFALPFLAAAVVSMGLAQWRLHRVRTDAGAHRAIEPVVHSYILLLAALAVANQPLWAPFVPAFYFAFVWTVSHRPMAAQI